MKLLPSITRHGLMLGAFAAVTTAMIAGTQINTADEIALAKRAAEEKQLLAIMPATRHDNRLLDNAFTLPEEDPLLQNRAPRTAYRATQGDETVGVIIPATARDGYSGDINLLVGVWRDGSIAGVRVTSHKETPGLGDAIDIRKSPWIKGFDGKTVTKPAKDNWLVRKDGGEFDQFTGATVTPRAVVAATRRALEYVDAQQDALFVSAGASEEPDES